MTHLRKAKLLFVVLIFGGIWVSRASAWNQTSALDLVPPHPTPQAPQDLPAPPAPPSSEALDPTAQLMLQEVARLESVPAERLSVGYFEEWKLPLTGVDFTYAKVLDTATGKDYAIGLDQNGAFVDPEALRGAERAAANAAYGKLHPSLMDHLQSLGPQDVVSVSIWLDMGGRDASIPRLDPSEAQGMTQEALSQYKAEGLARAAEIHQEVEQPLIGFLPTVGGRVLSAAETAPIVFAELPVQAIQQVADLPYVQTIDLVVQGGPEQDGGDEKQPPGGPDMATARPASKANIVEARGFTGVGVISAVVEGDSIEFDNPYIVDGTCGPTAACPFVEEHATAVGGILASTHSTARGTAPGIGSSLLSANGSGWNLPEHQAATNWALGEGAAVFNNSYFLEIDGVMHNSDRWMDYIVRVYADLEVKSAGNRGEEADKNVTSPGLGYNTLTVGAAEDKDTITWDDDAMAEISSYNEPGGREKPEVTATGCGEWVSGIGGEPGIVITGMFDPWIYDQGCGTSYAAPIVTGGGALLIQRAPGLDDWPEAEKAILIATALHNIEGDARISEVDGAGAVDLAAADTVAANGWWNGYMITPGMFDPDNNFAVRTIHLYAGERVRVALAYDSNPSADYTTDPLEGDLDLYLLNPASTIVASSAGVDSWEIIEYTIPPDGEGDYTIRLENHAGSLSDPELTFAGLAIWPGHYVLAPYAPQLRDAPPGAWNQDSGDDYRFTKTDFWNALAIRSPVGGDYDVYMFNNSVYGDPADHALLASSTYISSFPVDFVLIDGNQVPDGDFYATVSRYSGSGDYNIEHASYQADVNDGPYGPYTMTPSQVVRVWDSWHDNGVRKYYALKPTSGDANLGMALYASDPVNPSTFYRGRSHYVALADSAGAGGDEFMNYQSTADDWFGLVAWNNGATSNTSFILYADSSAPTGSISINGGATFTNSTSVTLDLSAEDLQTGVYEMRFSNDGVTWTGWEAYATSKAWTLTAGDGTKTVYVQYKNNAEMSTVSITDTIVLDTTPPTGSIVINGGAAYTNSTAATLTLSASDAGSGVYQMRFSNNGTTWSAWEAYATSKAWTLTAGDGTKTVFVQYSDSLGNVSASFTDTIILETIPPSGSIVINGGATYANSTAATLTLSASDADSGLYQMRFSNNGTTWSAWEAYGTSKAWTLTVGDGTKTVYVQYSDNVGNVSASFTDTIILDTTPPSSSALSPLSTEAYSFIVMWSGTDSLSGVASFDLQYRVGEGGAWVDWLTGTTATSAVFGPTTPVLVQPGQTYYFRVRARDNAGNVGAYPGGDGHTSTFVTNRVYLPLILR